MKEREILPPKLESKLLREGAIPIKPKAVWRDAIDIGERVTDFWKEHYPFSVEIELRPDAEYPNKPQLHYFDADWHLGAIGFSGGRFKEEIDLIENTPNAFLNTLGDDIDIGLFKDLAHLQAIPRFSQAIALQDLARELTKDNPRQRQLWQFACGGNHTFTVFERCGIFLEGFLQETGLKVLPGMGRVTLNVGKQEYKIAIAHKHPGRSKLNPTLSAKRLIEYFWPEADLGVAGHYHDRAYEEFSRGNQDRLAIVLGTRRTKEQLFELSRGYGQPVEGGIAVLFFPNEKEFIPHKSLEKGIRELKSYL